METLYQHLETGEGKATELKPKTYQALKDGFETFCKSKSLVLLSTEAPITVTDALVVRESPATTEFLDDDIEITAEPANDSGMVVDVVPDAPIRSLARVDFKSELEPRSMSEAVALAKHLFAAKMFSGYGTPQGVLATILAGRDYDLSSTAALRAFHIIEGRPTLSAGLITALVLRSGKAEYFCCTERSAERATFETKRKGNPKPMSLTYTTEEAREAGYLKPGSGWMKNRPDMLVARASTKLARLEYSDVLLSLYETDELRDSIGGAA
jgi:hypothetical protein